MYSATAHRSIVNGSSRRPVQIMFFLLLGLSMVLLVSCLSTSWTRISVSTGFTNIQYDLALKLTGMTTCITTPFTPTSCSSKSFNEQNNDGKGNGAQAQPIPSFHSGSHDDQQQQSSCKSDIIASEAMMLLAISLPLIGFGCYLVQDYVTKLKESGASWPLMIGVGLSFVLTVITIVVWATGGCYAGFKHSLEAGGSKGGWSGGSFLLSTSKVVLGEGWYLAIAAAVTLLLDALILIRHGEFFAPINFHQAYVAINGHVV